MLNNMSIPSKPVAGGFQNNKDLATENEPGIAAQFWVIISTLHIFGSTPVQLQTEKDKFKNQSHGINGKFYSFKWVSWRSLFVFGMATGFSLLWAKYILELGFRESFAGDSFIKSKEYFFQFTKRTRYGDNKEADQTKTSLVTMYTVARVLMFIFPTEHVMSLVFSWLDSPLLVEFLNNWHHIELAYISVFHSGHQLLGKDNNSSGDRRHLPMLSLTKWRNKFILFYAVLPTLIFGSLYMQMTIRIDDMVQTIVIILSAFHFIVFPMFDATKTVFMYKVMSEAFHQVKLCMSTSIGAPPGAGFVDPAHVRSCRNLLEMLRSQCRLLSKLQTNQELFHLGTNFVSIVLKMYIILNGDYDFENALRILTILATYTIWYLVTMFIKAYMADTIPLKEREIAEMLAALEPISSIVDPLVASETKFIHDMILLHPSEISLGNYFVFNKKLVLTMLGQIATYIIVLQQLTYN